MKRLLYVFIILLALVISTQAFGATAGTVTETLRNVYTTDGILSFKVVTLTCTASVDAATYPSTALTSAANDQLRGWSLMMMSTYNGSTAPTALYDVTLADAVGVDILGGAGANRPGTAGVSSQVRPRTDTSLLLPGLRPVYSTLTLAIANNAVNSAVVTIQLFFMR